MSPPRALEQGSGTVNLLNKTQIRGNFRTQKNLNWNFIYFLSENAATAKT